MYVHNIVFLNSERSFTKSRVDITECQHKNFLQLSCSKLLSSIFFVLYYKKYKTFSAFIYSYINIRKS